MLNLIPRRSQLNGIQLTLTHNPETKKSDQNQTTGYKNTFDRKTQAPKIIYATKIRVAWWYVVAKKYPEYPFNKKMVEYNYGILKILFTFWKQDLDLISWPGETFMTD